MHARSRRSRRAAPRTARRCRRRTRWPLLGASPRRSRTPGTDHCTRGDPTRSSDEHCTPFGHVDAPNRLRRAAFLGQPVGWVAMNAPAHVRVAAASHRDGRRHASRVTATQRKGRARCREPARPKPRWRWSPKCSRVVMPSSTTSPSCSRSTTSTRTARRCSWACPTTVASARTGGRWSAASCACATRTARRSTGRATRTSPARATCRSSPPAPR